MKLTRAINQAARAVQAKGAAGLQAASVECDNGGAAHITEKSAKKSKNVQNF